MYRVTCDGFPLLDWRDDDLILTAAKLRLEVNKVGDGSFTIYDSHPHFDKLARLRSVIEVSDETGIIFRGRATSDSIDFDNGMDVDMEGALAYFNDSLVRPFSFPGDFLQNEGYIAAEKSGNVIAFFLGWLIDNHNAQVEDFQKLKLGNVTVTDPNNYISRSNSYHASTWDTLRGKLFESSLGGYLCIRYEADGNYIDYLSEFTETNGQEIAYGENLLDLTREAEASGIYSAMLPVGALGLTIANLDDGDWSEDIVKSGDTVYSRKAVAQYGWIYAPASESTWEDVTQEINLLTKAAERLGGNGAMLNAVEATAVDLHFTDAQIESLRIYKNVKVHSTPHGLSEVFPLSKLEIDLIDPKRTKITVGKRLPSWTEIAALREEEAKINYSRLYKTDEEIRLEVAREIAQLSNGVVETLKNYASLTLLNNEITAAVESVNTSVDGKLEKYAKLSVLDDEITAAVSKINGELKNYAKLSIIDDKITAAVSGFVDGDEVNTIVDAALGKISLSVTNGTDSSTLALKIDGTTIASKTIKMTGLVTIAGLEGGTTTIDGKCIKTGTIDAERIAVSGGATDLAEILTGLETGDTVIDGGCIATNSLYANQMHLGGLLAVYDGLKSNVVGGWLGFDDGFDSSEGIGMRYQLNGLGAQCVCTDEAARISYSMKSGVNILQSGVVCESGLLTLDAFSLMQLRFADASGMTVTYDIDRTGFYPAATGKTLGTASLPWSDVYAAGTSMAELLERVEALEAQ